MKKSLIALAVLAAAGAWPADDRVVLKVRTSPERAAECSKVGCGLYTEEDLRVLRQMARADAMRDTARLLDTHGCLRGNT